MKNILGGLALGLSCLLGPSLKVPQACADDASLPSLNDYRNLLRNRIDFLEDAENMAAQQNAESEQRLHDAHSLLDHALLRWDASPAHLLTAQGALAKADQSFDQYRQKNCEWVTSFSQDAPSSAQKMEIDFCRSELNNRRAAILREAATLLPLKP